MALALARELSTESRRGLQSRRPFEIGARSASSYVERITIEAVVARLRPLDPVEPGQGFRDGSSRARVFTSETPWPPEAVAVRRAAEWRARPGGGHRCWGD